MFKAIIIAAIFIVAAHWVGNKWGTKVAAFVRAIGFFILSCCFFPGGNGFTTFLGIIGILATIGYVLYVLMKKSEAPTT